jgi:hypothetical protein
LICHGDRGGREGALRDRLLQDFEGKGEGFVLPIEGFDQRR